MNIAQSKQEWAYQQLGSFYCVPKWEWTKKNMAEESKHKEYTQNSVCVIISFFIFFFDNKPAQKEPESYAVARLEMLAKRRWVI